MRRRSGAAAPATGRRLGSALLAVGVLAGLAACSGDPPPPARGTDDLVTHSDAQPDQAAAGAQAARGQPADRPARRADPAGDRGQDRRHRLRPAADRAGGGRHRLRRAGRGRRHPAGRGLRQPAADHRRPGPQRPQQRPRAARRVRPAGAGLLRRRRRPGPPAAPVPGDRRRPGRPRRGVPAAGHPAGAVQPGRRHRPDRPRGARGLQAGRRRLPLGRDRPAAGRRPQGQPGRGAGRARPGSASPGRPAASGGCC